MRRLVSHETHLVKLAKTLASKHELKIVFKGNEAGTDGKTIYLPAVSQHLDAEHGVTNVLHGLLDHAVAENIEGDLERLNTLIKDKREKEMTGVVHDAWVEKQYLKRYPGAESNIDAMNDYCTKGLEKHWESLDPMRKIAAAVFNNLVGIELPFLDPMTQMVMGKLTPMLEEFPNCESSADCYNLACRLLKELGEMSDGGGEEQEQEGGGDSESQGGSSGGDEGEGDTEKSENGEDNNDDKGGDNEDSENEDGDDKGDKPKDGEGNGELPEKMAEELKASLERTPSDDMPSRSELAVEQIEAELPDFVHDFGDADRYLPYTTEGDRWEKAPDVPREDFIKLHSEIDNVILPLKRKLHTLLMAMKAGGWLIAQEEGRLDSSRLHKIFSSPNARDIRKRRSVQQAFNTAISIWVDHSGSMYGSKIRLAAMSCLALAEALQGTKIALQVVGWYEESNPADDRIRGASEAEKKLYTRWGNNIYIRYKDFDQDYFNARNGLAAMTDIRGYSNGKLGMDQNTDGECVKMAAEILLRRPEERKILIMIGDGLPAATGGRYAPHDVHCAYLKKVCTEVHKKTPVELVAICIGDDDMKHYYPDYIEIQNDDDIPEALVNRFCKTLREGMNMRPMR